MKEAIERVKSEAAEIDRYMHADLDSMGESIDALLHEVLEYGLFNGGKRIRPLLVVLASRLCSCASEDIYRLGIAFEYLHAATLFHDDIIDGSDTRRGRPAVYKKFDMVAAILAGDFLHAHSMFIVSKYTGEKGLNSFCRATKGMVDGEFMQLRNAAKHNLSELDYYNAIMGKTGLLIASACEVGAIYSQAGDEKVAALRIYGEKLGCAFQIIDDLLDYLGDSAKTGKAVGNDFAEGKMTLPLILALAKADDEDSQQLLAALEAGDSSKLSITEVTRTIDKYKGFDEARTQAKAVIREALAALDVFADKKASSEYKLLESLAYYVLQREK